MPTDLEFAADNLRAATSADYFVEKLRAIAQPLDDRTDEQLLVDASNHSDSIIREQALFEYSYRRGASSFSALLSAFQDEQEVPIKTSLLIAMAGIDGAALLETNRSKSLNVSDEGPLQSWLEALLGLPPTLQNTKTRTDPKEIFDQVIPLFIDLRLYVRVGPGDWRYWIVSPSVEERITGKVHACSRTDTRGEQIVVSKQLKGLHADESPHLEIVLFTGRTDKSPDSDQYAFEFATATPAPFYPSGRIGDTSRGIVNGATIMFNRAGTITTNSAITVRGMPVVNSVTGSVRGWGFVEPSQLKFDDTGHLIMRPGIFQLASIVSPEARSFTNVYLDGSFRGVIGDYDGDGLIDLNTTPSYATFGGEIDLNRDGVADVPGQHFTQGKEIIP